MITLFVEVLSDFSHLVSFPVISFSATHGYKAIHSHEVTITWQKEQSPHSSKDL
jgi:hypothetical protein